MRVIERGGIIPVTHDLFNDGRMYARFGQRGGGGVAAAVGRKAPAAGALEGGVKGFIE